MKKFISIVTLTLLFSTLFSCGQPSKNIEGISIIDLEGSGTMIEPYQAVIIKNEITTLNLDITPLDYTDGIKAYEAEETEVGFLELLEDAEHKLEVTLSGTTLSIKGLKFGTSFVKVQAGMIFIIIEVRVERGIVDFVDTLKVLAIGNSFSEDGMEYLYKVASDYGVREIVLGNMCIDGASLETHVNSIKNNSSNYKYKKNDSDAWVITTGNKLRFGLQDEDWDIIVVQQVSGKTGQPATFDPFPDELLTFVKENRTNPEAKIYWHMTWAYQANSTHNDFKVYNNNQMQMYNTILSTTQSKIVTRDDFSGIIPSGTTIQNLRTSYLGDTLTNDGYHLSLPKGRYAAALTWFRYLTNLSIDNITYRPIGASDVKSVTEKDLANMKEAVNSAVPKNPFVITPSTFTE